MRQELQDFLRAYMATLQTPQLAMIHSLWRNAEDLVERHMSVLVQNFERMQSMTYDAFTIALAALGQVQKSDSCVRACVRSFVRLSTFRPFAFQYAGCLSLRIIHSCFSSRRLYCPLSVKGSGRGGGDGEGGGSDAATVKMRGRLFALMRQLVVLEKTQKSSPVQQVRKVRVCVRARARARVCVRVCVRVRVYTNE